MNTANESAAGQFNDPDMQRYLSNLKKFLSLFTPGKMNEDLWQLTCMLYRKHDETNWQYSGRFNVYGMYILLCNLCNSMQEIVAYFETQMNTDFID